MTVRLILEDNSVVVEQMDFMPLAGQIVVSLNGRRYRVLEEPPEAHHISLGKHLAAKWMQVVKVVKV